MWSTKDIAVVIIISVVSFVYSALVSQLPTLLTGILGLNYFFIFGHAIFISFALLLYEGRRWRFFLQNILVMSLTLPTFQTGPPFDILARMPIIASSFFIDLVFNSIYAKFQKSNRALWWSIISTVVFLLQNGLFIGLNMLFFYPSELLSSFVSIYLVLLPIIVAEAVFGSIVGYKLWKRSGITKTNKTLIKYD